MTHKDSLVPFVVGGVLCVSAAVIGLLVAHQPKEYDTKGHVRCMAEARNVVEDLELQWPRHDKEYYDTIRETVLKQCSLLEAIR